MANDSVRIENGWSLYGHPFFITRLGELIGEIESLAESSPQTFHRHPAYKLLECVRTSLLSNVPADPTHRDFRLGNTLGPKNKHWRRVKKGLPNRYRMFFQFRSEAPQTIIYAWLNDERTLRKDGARTDVYAVFCRMLASSALPSSFDALLAEAKEITI